SHIGVVLYFDGTNGRLLAILDASSLTAIRTAAVSGLATRLLARANAKVLAILGSGVQAMTHLEAMRCVRPFAEIREWSRREDSAQAFAQRAGEQFECRLQVAPTAELAVRGADVVCTTTAAREPVLLGQWLAPGAHVNAVGASVPSARELDSEAVRRARLFVDRRESVLAEAGDFLFPRNEGVIDDAHVLGELGELVLGRVAGRQRAQEITVFKSLGIAIEDVASARFIYERALKENAGTWLQIGGLR
ncbi:MAG: ornithine cyclodeaminase family protein, partial [Steroidobacteraceae bacterium]